MERNRSVRRRGADPSKNKSGRTGALPTSDKRSRFVSAGNGSCVTAVNLSDASSELGTPVRVISHTRSLCFIAVMTLSAPLVICKAQLKARKPGQPSPRSPSRAEPWWGLWRAQGPAQGSASPSRALKPGLLAPVGVKFTIQYNCVLQPLVPLTVCYHRLVLHLCRPLPPRCLSSCIKLYCRKHTWFTRSHCIELSGQQCTQHVSQALSWDHISPELHLTVFRSFLPFLHAFSCCSSIYNSRSPFFISLFLLSPRTQHDTASTLTPPRRRSFGYNTSTFNLDTEHSCLDHCAGLLPARPTWLIFSSSFSPRSPMVAYLYLTSFT